MVSKEIQKHYTAILKSELIEALGCTEPIAIAYAAAKAKAVLGNNPTHMEIGCSGNIVKNVKGVVVPNTGGQVGIAAAGIAGVVGGNPDMVLQVLENITEQDRMTIKELAQENFCKVYHLKGVENLYIVAKVFNGDSSAEIYIQDSHDNIIKIVKDNEEIFSKKSENCHDVFEGDRTLLTVKNIIEYAESIDLSEVEDLILNQVKKNTAISVEGLKNLYGVNVGKTMIEHYGEDIKVRARAKAAAGSDARMSGAPLPVVINSGSGNQGITVSIPVIEYAKEYKVSDDKLIKALIISNLVSIHQKHQIGKLSAYCGAVSAAAGSGAGVTYLSGGGYEEVSNTIINTIANIGGMVCDGAKPSCAAKIASAVDAAILAHQLSMNGKVFKTGEGVVKDDVEQTIQSIGQMAKKGMEYTDVEIIEIMLG